MSTRPRHPWRVVLEAPTGPSPEAEFTSEAKTYAYVREELRKAEAGETETTAIRINQWESGRWWHFETVKPVEQW
ncbi:hypothetical protein AB0G60_02895 [Streptomyces angustmyceticus]|uniref:Uncharacterized protein n=1 Tax=Streptomyces angustmyceticus TaxID=285578 RepID=A0A5J4L8Q2_9ACTN|nr:hypothetical protein [Streptomyces angustmyceticus]UAL65609.1 hypothetical protein K7396_02860 [Streptomyces angustmyceticus]GES27869.1 hypothetical protein San01_03560 [Streptomyces angustmyceticus]